MAASILGCFTGRRTMNIEPFPGSLSALMVPPCRSTILRHMASPIPVPSYSPAAVQSLEGLENKFGKLLVKPDAVVLYKNLACPLPVWTCHKP